MFFTSSEKDGVNEQGYADRINSNASGGGLALSVQWTIGGQVSSGRMTRQVESLA